MDNYSEHAVDARDFKVGSSFDCFRRDISDIPILTREQEFELAKKAAAGDMAARNKLIESNIKWVCHIASGFKNCGLSEEDLVQEGILGLITAVEKFDYTMGYRLSTYATEWIEKAMRDAIPEQTREIHIPSNILNKLNKINKNVHELKQRLGRNPDISEISNEVGMSENEVINLMKLPTAQASWNIQIDENGNASREDIHNDVTQLSVEEIVVEKCNKAYLTKLLKKLPAREREIIELRYGLGGGKIQMPSKIAKHFGISTKDVQEIIDRILADARKDYLL